MQESNYNIKKIVFVGIIILIIAAIIGYLILRPSSSSQTNPGNAQNIFPYGTNSTNPNSVNGTGVSSGTNPVQTGTVPTGTNPLSLAGQQALRQIANYPVTGYFPSIQKIVTKNPQLDPKTGATIFKTVIVPTNMIRWNSKATGVLFDAQVTDDAIIESQKTNTLVPDAQEIWFGNTGNTAVYRSWDAAGNVISSYLGTLPNTSSTIPAYCTVSFTQPLKRGSTGAQVVALQKYLNQKLHLTLSTDGVLGMKTLSHIQDLQTALAMSPLTGSYDAATRAAMNADCAAIQAAASSATVKPVALKGKFLGAGILRGATSPDGSQFFFLAPAKQGVIGVIVNADGTKPRNVFSSPITEWMPQWVNKTTIAMTTLASDQAPGYLYFLNPTTGVFTKILGPIQGLTTLTDPSAQNILYSQSANQSFTTHLYTVATGATADIGLATLPEKCVWQDTKMIYCAVPQNITPGDYPDNWYQGTVSFTDDLWSINISTKVTKDILSPSQLFDMIHLGTSPDGSYLYFINKTDGTLWSLKHT